MGYGARRTLATAAVVTAVLAASGNLAALVAETHPDVFFSVDGGIKHLMVDQLVRGKAGPELRPRHRGELSDLWNEGMFLAPTFAHQVYAEDGRFLPAYPWTFPAVSAPFYAAFGRPGLRILPLLGVLFVFGAFADLCRRRQLGPLGASVATVAVGLASPFPVYGALFWEHAPAVALGFAGFLEWTAPAPVASSRYRRPALLGGLAGLGFWLRPEAGILAGSLAGAAVLVVGRRQPWRVLAFSLGAMTAGLAFLGLEMALTGEPLGFHARQSLDPSLSARWRSGSFHGRRMLEDALDWMPWLAAVPFVALLQPALRWGGAFWVAALAIPPFVVGTALVVPNAGGHAPGPRYLLPALPLAAFLVGRAADAGLRLPRPGPWIVSLVLAALLTTSAVGIRRSHVPRFAAVFRPDNVPCHEAIVAQPASDLLVFNEAWYAAHLSGSHGDRRVVAAPTAAHLRRAQELADRSRVGIVLVSSGRSRHRFDHLLPSDATRVGACGVADVHRWPASPRASGSAPTRPTK